MRKEKKTSSTDNKLGTRFHIIEDLSVETVIIKKTQKLVLFGFIP